MNSVNTTITTSGNSAAVRLPRELLRMSGLSGKTKVRLTAKKNQIVITKHANPRDDWEKQIDALLAIENDPSKEFEDMKSADSDGLNNLAWDGPSFEDWQKTHDKVS